MRGIIRVLIFAAMAFPAEAAEWDFIYNVLSHPRCAACHSPDERPRWFDAEAGAFIDHAMNVQRGADGFGNPGLRCATCHQAQNSAAVGGPPGAAKWHLAPAEMAWVGRTSAEVCAQFKDVSRTGGRDLAAMAEHIRTDALVAWGWAPGEGRAPAPGSAEETYQAILKWQSAGAPCS